MFIRNRTTYTSGEIMNTNEIEPKGKLFEFFNTIANHESNLTQSSMLSVVVC